MADAKIVKVWPAISGHEHVACSFVDLYVGVFHPIEWDISVDIPLVSGPLISPI